MNFNNKKSLQDSNQIHKIVEDATSEVLKEPNWPMNLAICQWVNTEKVSAMELVCEIKKQIMIQCPSIQYLSMVLLETCFKNYDTTLSKVTEEVVLDYMVRIIYDLQTVDTNCNKALIIIKAWRESTIELHSSSVFEFEETSISNSLKNMNDNNEGNEVQNSDENVSNIFSHNDHIAIEPHNTYPYVGLEFDSLEDVKNFYREFAKKEGFGIRTRSSKHNSCILVCSNVGKHIINNICNEESIAIKSKREKRCSTLMIGCKTTLVTSKAHKSAKYLRCHKKISGAAKNLVKKFDQEGLPTGKVVALFNNQDSTFSNRDCWNYLTDLRSRNLDVGDAQSVFNFCKQK
ncbi:protein FAR1-RELATED SEQUENCE 5 [Lathyrus oleraceus]|uniref:VHS domain-containing protein n=1 Tax=Pisum sativum TaxID=3888 RepID=A0A9D5A8Z1_PEA|nr:protein FAR1-RELATED SEQUENCE 5-like [Pisum sativum]KAI5402382.1 hypothetical protein KIW84_050124 [Pisum sativum]